MHQNPNSTSNPGTEANKNKSYTVCSQPWWHGIGHDGFSRHMLGETMTDIIAAEQRATGDSGSKTSKSQVKGGPDEGTEVNKETQVIAMSQSGTCLQFYVEELLDCFCSAGSIHNKNQFTIELVIQVGIY